MRRRSVDVRQLRALRRRQGLVAVFDLDGTLAPIASTPAGARVPAGVRRALGRLARRDDTTVGVVSGRPLAQVIRLIGQRAVWLVGLHGFARRAPGGASRRLWTRGLEHRAIRLAVALRAQARRVPGVLVERKGPVVALHVRGVRAPRRDQVYRNAIRLHPAGFVVVRGRRVLEFRPAGGPTKGDAVRAIAAARPLAPILYVGDDTTDADAFAALGAGDFPVLVEDARARTERPRLRVRARYRLAGPRAVARLVERLARPG